MSRSGAAVAPATETRLPGRAALRAAPAQAGVGPARAWQEVTKALDLARGAGDRVRVQRGDTLWGLVGQRLATQGQAASAAAIQQAVTVVAAANGIADPDRIYAADVVDLSVLDRQAALAIRVRSAAPAPSAPGLPARPVAQTGDLGAGANALLDATLDRAVRKGYLPAEHRIQVRDRVVEMASRLGFAPDDLARVALVESDGFDPSASNGRCFGVIQFCEGAGRGADSVGYAGRAAEIASQPVLAQLDLVERYLGDVGVGAQGRRVALDDLYLAVLMPAARAQTDPNAALGIPGRQARVLHEGMDRDRPITRRSIVAGLNLQAQRALGRTDEPVSTAAAAGHEAASQRQALAAVAAYRQVASAGFGGVAAARR
ncbi:MAG: hypothetical protein RLZ83_1500 [Pseudomonadota bacterium]|jgi:hypothetical protein